MNEEEMVTYETALKNLKQKCPLKMDPDTLEKLEERFKKTIIQKDKCNISRHTSPSDYKVKLEITFPPEISRLFDFVDNNSFQFGNSKLLIKKIENELKELRKHYLNLWQNAKVEIESLKTIYDFDQFNPEKILREFYFLEALMENYRIMWVLCFNYSEFERRNYTPKNILNKHWQSQHWDVFPRTPEMMGNVEYFYNIIMHLCELEDSKWETIKKFDFDEFIKKEKEIINNGQQEITHEFINYLLIESDKLINGIKTVSDITIEMNLFNNLMSKYQNLVEKLNKIKKNIPLLTHNEKKYKLINSMFLKNGKNNQIIILAFENLLNQVTKYLETTKLLETLLEKRNERISTLKINITEKKNEYHKTVKVIENHGSSLLKISKKCRESGYSKQLMNEYNKLNNNQFKKVISLKLDEFSFVIISKLRDTIKNEMNELLAIENVLKQMPILADIVIDFDKEQINELYLKTKLRFFIEDFNPDQTNGIQIENEIKPIVKEKLFTSQNYVSANKQNIRQKNYFDKVMSIIGIILLVFFICGGGYLYILHVKKLKLAKKDLDIYTVS